MIAVYQNLFHVIRDNRIRNPGPYKRVKADRHLYAVHAVDLVEHCLCGFGVKPAVRDNHMGRTHLKIFVQFVICRNAVEVFRQRSSQIVVHIRMCVAVHRRH